MAMTSSCVVKDTSHRMEYRAEFRVCQTRGKSRGMSSDLALCSRVRTILEILKPSPEIVREALVYPSGLSVLVIHYLLALKKYF